MLFSRTSMENYYKKKILEILYRLLRQRQALIALANPVSNEKIFSGDFIKKYGLASAPSFRKALKSLISIS